MNTEQVYIEKINSELEEQGGVNYIDDYIKILRRTLVDVNISIDTLKYICDNTINFNSNIIQSECIEIEWFDDCDEIYIISICQRNGKNAIVFDHKM